ncbi:MAG: ParB/RepB/Spo0J family partition protein [Rickettsiales bacterium]|nr:ParB/RepB/Spo0J family partition protein [Rickettsiales bacterium]
MSSAPAKKGLGKGLSALMGEEYSQSMSGEPSQPTEAAPNSGAGTNSLAIDQLHAGTFQPRVRFNEENLQELADSIKKNGIMQPLVVRPSTRKEGQYEIIAGERRWRASKIAQLSEVPVIVREIDDQTALELAIIENVQRQDLTPLEEAAGYQRLIDEFTYTQDQVSKTVGKSRSHVANLLRLLSLPDEIKVYMDKGELSMGHARALLNADAPVELAQRIVKEGLNVRQAELLVKGGDIDAPPAVKSGTSKPKSDAPASAGPSKEKDADIIALEQTLSQSLGLSVAINERGGQSGEVVLEYNSLGQLDEILRRIGDSI